MTTEEKLSELVEILDTENDINTKISIWEIDFLENLREKLDQEEPYFTDKQIEKINEIYFNYGGDGE